MEYSILGLLHNLKDYQHYEGEPYKLTEDEKNVLIDFLEQTDVQKCIPKVPQKVICGDEVVYACATCHRTNIWKGIDKCNCGQKIKWVEENNEKAEHVGSKIFDTFDVTISKFPNSITSTSEEEMDSSKENR